MSYKIVLYSLQKKQKSTKNPSGSGYAINNILLKEGSSLFTPQLKVTLTDKESVNLAAYNCFYLYEEISNADQMILGLYKIMNIENIFNNTWLISGEIDPLSATASQIKSSSQFVTRISLPTSESGGQTVEGYDDRQYDSICNPTTEIVTKGRTTISSGFSLSQCMSVMGFNGQGMEFYASRFTPQGIANEALDTSDIMDLIEQNLGKANDYFTMAKIFPFYPDPTANPNNFSTYPDSPTYIGTYLTICKGGKQIKITDFSAQYDTAYVSRRQRFESSINCININTEYTDFRRYDNRFTQIVANCPFVGMVDIDPYYLNYETIHFVYYIDILTGSAELSVYASISGYNKEIGSYSCQIGIDVPISNYNTNWMRIATQIYEKGITGAIESQINPPTDKYTLSNLSGFASYTISSINIEWKQFKSTSRDYTNYRGRPCNKLLSLSSLPSGTYIECLNPDLDIIKQDYIREQAISALSSGIYLE